MEATPGIEIHENRHSQSRSASISHFITRVQRPTSRLSPIFRMVVHGVVPNSYQDETTRNEVFEFQKQILLIPDLFKR